MSANGTPLLATESVSVRFGGLQALQDVSVDVAPGSITGLIGPNGAGKTTLFNVVCGLQPVGGGRVLFDGEDVTAEPAHRRGRLGIARTFQRLEVFNRLSVRDNLLVAWESRFARGGWIARALGKGPDPQEGVALAGEVVDLLGLAAIVQRPAGSLPTGAGRVVELGRALCTRPRLLLLDEPTSGLDRAETESLGRMLVEAASRWAVTVLLVEHDVDLVMQVCDRIHVLDFGRLIATGTPAEIREDEAVQAAYLGEHSRARLEGARS